MGGTGEANGVLFEGLLDGSYDCVDRVVLRAYFQLGQRAPGLRMWWRRWQGSDEGLNNTRLMRVLRPPGEGPDKSGATRAAISTRARLGAGGG